MRYFSSNDDPDPPLSSGSKNALNGENQGQENQEQEEEEEEEEEMTEEGEILFKTTLLDQGRQSSLT